MPALILQQGIERLPEKNTANGMIVFGMKASSLLVNNTGFRTETNIILQGILSDDKATYQDNTENPEVEVVTTTSLPRARVLYILQRLQGRRTTINLMRQYNIYYSNNSNVYARVFYTLQRLQSCLTGCLNRSYCQGLV